jgi:hypothetical protein
MKPGLILLLLLLSPLDVGAQQPPATPAKPEPTAQQQPAATENPATEKSAPSSEPFVPSETISEDLSVPFPVDI